MDQYLNNKTVLISGASRGLGATFAEHFAKSGAFVTINYKRKEKTAEALLKKIQDAGGTGMLLPFDVTQPDDIKNGIEQLIKKRGQIDILVNNAGIVADNFFFLMSDIEWHKVIDTNLHGSYYLVQAVIPGMLSRQEGSIINIASVAGIHASPGQANYAAAKGALISFTKTLATELAPKGIRVNTVVPGLIATGMTTRLNRDISEKKKAAIPMGRFGEAAEVAKAVLFLSSERASYITGQCLVVDGGLTN